MIALACSDDEEHPPQYVPPDPGPPLSCWDLQDAGVWPPPTDGGNAPCAADGLECVLYAISICDAGQVAVAHCVEEIWKLDCAGAADASP